MNATSLLFTFSASLILTIIIEEFIAILFGARMKLEFLIVVLVNTLTNPAMVLYYVLISRCFLSVSPVLLQLPGETVVFLTEAYVYRYMGVTDKYRFPHPFLLSFAANLISWMSGILLQSVK